MQKIFLTATDQIIDVNFVIGIEVENATDKYSNVIYHLSTGVTIVSRQVNHDAAVEEKWQAYQLIKSQPVARAAENLEFI